LFDYCSLKRQKAPVASLINKHKSIELECGIHNDGVIVYNIVMILFVLLFQDACHVNKFCYSPELGFLYYFLLFIILSMAIHVECSFLLVFLENILSVSLLKFIRVSVLTAILYKISINRLQVTPMLNLFNEWREVIV